MIPPHVTAVYNTLTKAQQNRFQELLIWAGSSGMKGSSLPVNYDHILEMVLRMGETPVVPVEPPPVLEEPLIRDKQKI